MKRPAWFSSGSGPKRPGCFRLAVWISLAVPGLIALPSHLSSLPAASPEKVASGPQVDPFYRKLFESGERAFLDGKYGQAAQDLEIAAFGLAKDKALAGKTYIYLSICYSHLANRDKSRQFLSLAAQSLGPDEVKGLDLGEKILVPLRKLAADFRIDLEVPPPPTAVPVSEKRPAGDPLIPDPAAKKATEEPPPDPKPPPAKKVEPPPPVVIPPEKKTAEPPDAAKKAAAESKPPAEKAVQAETPPPAGAKTQVRISQETPDKPSLPQSKALENPEPDIREFERWLKSDPGNAGIVYELASLYFKRGDYREAKKMLGRFLDKRPYELRAVFYLAKSSFFLADYRSAMRDFNRLSSAAAEAALERDVNLKVAIYKALCLFSMGQESSVPAFIQYVKANAPPDELARLLEDEGLAGRWEAMVARIGL